MTLPVPIKIVPADNFEPHRFDLNDSNYVKIYTKVSSKDVAFIKIRNTSTSNSVYIAPNENVGDNDTDSLAAGAMMEERMNPEEIWAKRSGSSTITVIVTVFYYDQEEA